MTNLYNAKTSIALQVLATAFLRQKGHVPFDWRSFHVHETACAFLSVLAAFSAYPSSAATGAKRQSIHRQVSDISLAFLAKALPAK